MRTILFMCLTAMGILLSQSTIAQPRTVTGFVTDASTNEPLPGVNVVIKTTTQGTSTGVNGSYSIIASPGQVLVFTSIGYTPKEVTVESYNRIDVSLSADVMALGEIIVTALGIKSEKKSLGIAVTEVKGAEIMQTQRINFVDALQGRVAGIAVNQSSGLPGASSSVVIRGISSLSGSNEPLYVVDGLPYNNNTFSTNVFASGGISGPSMENRYVDFTNRAADINPDDIESITILKGPEATSLYGVDASNGAIIITTKRGKAGALKVNYSNNFSLVKINKYPEIQQVYGQGNNGITNNTVFSYFGEPYAADSVLYDNIKPFFQTGFSQSHNLSLDGGTEKMSYRLSYRFSDVGAIVPGAGQKKINISNSLHGELSKYFTYDFSMAYTNDFVDGVFKSSYGPMIGMLRWPSGDDASKYLNPDGTRRIISTAGEIENPFFNIAKNDYWTKTSRLTSVTSFNIIPTDWFRFVGKIGFDIYANQNYALRHPESVMAYTYGGLIDDAGVNNRSLNFEYYANFKKKFGAFDIDVKAGSTVYDYSYKSVAGFGQGFLDPNFASLNNVPPDKMRTKSYLTQRRVIGAFGVITLNWNRILNLQFNARNDWSSTLPVENNSFAYPGANFALLLSEIPAIKDLTWLSLAKIRGAYGVARKDPPPYGVYPALESQLTTGGGYAYGFTGPNPLLKPEKTTSFEYGFEVRVLQNRLGIDATYYKKESVDQIISNLRLSYGTGFVLSVMNGGTMWNSGVELQFFGVPVQNQNLRWQIDVNFDKMWSKLTYLPTGLLEFYNSDTWIYGNTRNGAIVGEPTTTLSGLPYQRNNNGDILINPQTGLPLRKTTWGSIGDRNPDFTVGINNRITYKNFELSFLIDTRKGGDVLNATEHMLVITGLSKRTLDRYVPVVVKGVLLDGFENTDSPTWNNVQIMPGTSGYSYYYTTPNNGMMNEEDFVERNINWVRLKDITLTYAVPKSFLTSKVKAINNLSVFVTFTDLFLLTNYRGLDPVILGNNAAVLGSGSAGMDYGNFPLPRGVNFGLKVGF
ncbi:MAG: SusC/RagA family TonB-linked outer membrane protein [Bacteroidales bacterium]